MIPLLPSMLNAYVMMFAPNRCASSRGKRLCRIPSMPVLAAHRSHGRIQHASRRRELARRALVFEGSGSSRIAVGVYSMRSIGFHPPANSDDSVAA